ncbi:MAG: 5-formyltetrahydrofolate cyclo-ligase [Sideroxydans sp.]|nr:5-formyltetrahydrofolate cyclo-ligase [Sideroxydans sp.]
MADHLSDIQARKLALRQRIIAARDNLTPSLRTRSSKDIVAQLCGLASYRTARTVLGYLNFGSELASEAWVRQALEDSKRVLLPRVNKASKHLELFEVKDLDGEVAARTYGIREPIIEKCKRFEALGELDLILMPGVAFDREGGRLGYGGGYFDKLLAQLPRRPVLIAGAFAMQVVAEIPQEGTDHKIDWLVTENETIRCNLGRE